MIQCSRHICQADSAEVYFKGLLYLDLSVPFVPSSVLDKKIALRSPIITYPILSACNSITSYKIFPTWMGSTMSATNIMMTTKSCEGQICGVTSPKPTVEKVTTQK